MRRWTMTRTDTLKKEIAAVEKGVNIRKYFLYSGYKDHHNDPVAITRAYAIKALFTLSKKHIYKSDLIAGSIRGLFASHMDGPELERAEKIADSYDVSYFWSNFDHFAPDLETILELGIGGMIRKISGSMDRLNALDKDEEERRIFLQAAKISMESFSEMAMQYANEARKEMLEADCEEEKLRLRAIADTCEKISIHKPESYREALQLVWLIFQAFSYEGRKAMAFGRLDQYLYRYYRKDKDQGIITREAAVELMENALLKIIEFDHFLGYNYVANICIGGVMPQGEDAVNELSYVILEAVRNCNIPGPNLSARIHNRTDEDFLSTCLDVIGTGLGYPALMNDEVNIPALLRRGYSLEDSRNYAMVGCIENFIPGKQPPWSDGRFNVPKYLEAAINRGNCILTGQQLGYDSGDVSEIKTMEMFMEVFEKQLAYGAEDYMCIFRNENRRINPKFHVSPFLSCFCNDCIERGMDINDGGAFYPSVHGAACMGISTVADSLAALEYVVFDKKLATLTEVMAALKADFMGYEKLQAVLLKAPKYGNNDDYADKYAVWYVEYISRLFDHYRTRDGGSIYIAIAANVENISAGAETAATPDGRRARQALSDAASPMYGMDKNGPTAVVNSVTKPDYTLVTCGTVLNQKFNPDMLRDPQKKKKLLALIRTYFEKGGQEMQINSISREVLLDAAKNPEKYSTLVVRVSGFSAYYTTLSREVQADILARTEHS
jgi:pyruvate formate-lyase/glycerol dehydratase family glycyl radical enzyme